MTRRWRRPDWHRAFEAAIRARRHGDALLDRIHRLAGHPGESLNFSFQGECLGRKFPMLQRVPIALSGPATAAVHPADVAPAPLALGTVARSASIWRGISTSGA